ncbi:MAG: DUF4190 domain-containing protein [Pseudonocardiaceae bacterium]
MSAEWMWWGRRPSDNRLHAVAPGDIALAAERGFTEALCGQQLPVGVELLSGPDGGPVCGACHLGATADLESELPALAPFIPAATGQDAAEMVDRSWPEDGPSSPTNTAFPTPVGRYPPPTNTLAILALVLAFAFWPLAIVFGHLARRQIRRTGESGRGLATAGLVIGYLVLGLVVLAVIALVVLVGAPAPTESPGMTP